MKSRPMEFVFLKFSFLWDQKFFFFMEVAYGTTSKARIGGLWN